MIEKPIMFVLALATITACSVSDPARAPQIQASPPAEAAQRPVLAEAANQAPPFGVQVLDVRKAGPDTIRVELMVNNRARPGAPAAELESVQRAVEALAGLSIVSQDGYRRAFPLRDAAGRPVWCGLEPVAPGQGRQFWVMFPALSGDTARVTIVAPGLPPMRDVPVSEGSDGT